MSNSSLKRYKDEWKHVKNINFQLLNRRPIVEILTNMDYNELHFLAEVVKCILEESIARFDSY